MAYDQVAIEAIKARIDGDYDNPALQTYGPLSDTFSDVIRIAESALHRQFHAAPVKQGDDYDGEDERAEAAFLQQQRDRADQFAGDVTQADLPRLQATFVPQCWVGGKRGGDTAPIENAAIEFDATVDVLERSLDELQALKDGDMVTDQIGENALDDGRVCHPEKGGPYVVEIDEDVRMFFGVCRLSEITQDMLDAKREAYGVEAPSNGVTP